MRILIVSPAPAGVPTGNAITAGRWRRILESLGHTVAIGRRFDRQQCDLLIALHAVKSGASIRRFARLRPGSPLIVALTGTDIYSAAKLELDTATAVIALQRQVRLPRQWSRKLVVIPQSAEPCVGAMEPPADRFVVSVAAHLRTVKDPLLTARAARLLPPESRIAVEHYGRALEPGLAREAWREQRTNPRYRWHGETQHEEARRNIARSHVLVVSSKSEGGANVIAEAAADRVPVIATRIPGNIGMLGARYPGLFPPGDERALARLLLRAETDPRFLASLRRDIARAARKLDPERERDAWRRLLDKLQ